MYVCMYVCMYVWVCMCVYVCMYVCISVFIYIYFFFFFFFFFNISDMLVNTHWRKLSTYRQEANQHVDDLQKESQHNLQCKINCLFYFISISFIYLSLMSSGKCLFQNLSHIYLTHRGIGHMVKESGNLLLPLHGLLFLISSNGSFICTIPQTG